MELFDRNKRTVQEIFDGFDQEKLIVDPSYQRRQVWLVQDKVRLIETILMGLIIPEVFFECCSKSPSEHHAASRNPTVVHEASCPELCHSSKNFQRHSGDRPKSAGQNGKR